MKSFFKRAFAALAIGVPLVVACGADVDPPRGGVIVTVVNDGTLDISRVDVVVTAADKVLLERKIETAQTPLPNTLSIVSNGKTSTATVSVSAWKGSAPMDRRDKLIENIPSDRTVALTLYLSARCTELVRANADKAESTCPPAETCSPELSRCDTRNVDASKLPVYDPNVKPGPLPGRDAAAPVDDPNRDAGSDAQAPDTCVKDEDCAGPLTRLVPAGCATAKCSLENKCVYTAIDRDGDGFGTKKCTAVGSPIQIELGEDCDDTSEKVRPGAYDGPTDPDDANRSDSCDGIDTDCNGTVDDGKTGGGKACECQPTKTRECSAKPDGTPIDFPTGATPVGKCQRGTQTCNADGQWGPCNGAILPAARSCGSSDDFDCDGKPDNEIDALCTCKLDSEKDCYPYPTGTPGNGQCANGKQKCVANGTGGTEWGSCTNAVGPADADTCEPGNDANCNGTRNEGCTCVTGDERPCAGQQCGAGTQKCTAGAWGACENISAVSEPCAGATCGTGTRTCSNGIWGACAGATQAARACTGASCGSGTQECLNGTWQTCSLTTRPTRSCSGSQCGTGSQQCTTTGTWGSCTNITGTAGTCTGICASGTKPCLSSGTYGSCTFPSFSETCTKADGCGGGSRSCSGGGNWTTCTGGPVKKCRPGTTLISNGTCVISSSRTEGFGIWDDMPENGSWSSLGGVSNATSTTLTLSYSDGGCWDGDPTDQVNLSCNNGYSREISGCEAGSGSGRCATSHSFNPGPGAGTCWATKRKGWTPFAQGMCKRRFEMAVTWYSTIESQGCY